MEATYTLKLQIKRKLAKSATARIKYLTGLCKWLWRSSISMIGKSFTEIWKLRIFSWIKMAQSKLVILGLRECCSIHTIVPRRPLVLHIIYRLKFAKRSHITRSQTFGHSGASFMKWWLWDMPSMLTQWKD